jgi:hypothetical protein
MIQAINKKICYVSICRRIFIDNQLNFYVKKLKSISENILRLSQQTNMKRKQTLKFNSLHQNI